MKITPQAINVKSRGKAPRAQLIFPAGMGPNDIDPDQPIMLMTDKFAFTVEKVNFSTKKGRLTMEVPIDRKTLAEHINGTGQIKASITVPLTSGNTVYAIPEFEPDRIAPLDQLRRVMGEWVAEVAQSGNIVVLRTPPGCAHVVASALDRSRVDGMLGTVAGDDTLMCVSNDPDGSELAARLRQLAGIN